MNDEFNSFFTTYFHSKDITPKRLYGVVVVVLLAGISANDKKISDTIITMLMLPATMLLVKLLTWITRKRILFI